MDYRSCNDNADIVENYHDIVAARVDCEMKAEDMSTYGSPKWPWSPFKSFEPGDDAVKTGVIRLIETMAQFQNMFGVYVKVVVTCDYDLLWSGVSALSFTEGR